MKTAEKEVNSPALVPMAFHGDEIITFKVDDEPYVAMRRIVENLDMSWGRQQAKLQAATQKFSCTLMGTTGADGKTYQMLSMPVAKLPLWLASINPARIKDKEKRAKIELYQEESARALYDYWTKGVAVKDDYALPSETLEQIERVFGMVRMLAGKVTSMEKTVNQLTAGDPKATPALGFQTAKDIMLAFGFRPGEIRGRAGHLSHKLRKFSMENGHPLRLTHETRRCLFHVDAVQAWISGDGQDWLITKLFEARSKRDGQGHLKLIS